MVGAMRRGIIGSRLDQGAAPFSFGRALGALKHFVNGANLLFAQGCRLLRGIEFHSVGKRNDIFHQIPHMAARHAWK